jgi:exopolysaccharide biosynthesis polyprenyl glycosylphosphotransferase
MKNNVSLLYNFSLVVGDFLALVTAFVGAYILRVTIDHRPLAAEVPAHTYLSVFLVMVPFWILIFIMLGLYDSNIYEKRFIEIGRLFVGSFIGLMFVVFWNFIAIKPIFPAKLVPIYGFILAFIFLVIFRNLARLVRTILFRYGIGITNVLIIGNTDVASELAEALRNSKKSGYRVVGIIGSKHQSQGHKFKVFGSFEEASKAVNASELHSIVQTELYSSADKNDEVLSFAQANHISYRFIPGNTELFVGNIDVELFRSSIPVIAVHQTALLGWGRIVKRLFDLCLGIPLLIILSPILILIALAIKLTSRGPVFLRQVRLTRFNQEFRVFKFRSHNSTYSGLDPDQAFTKMNRPDLLKEFRENGNFLKHDPRETKVGRFIRRTSLDELPQLFNVVKGDLSLVGPRALIPKDLAAYKKRHTILSVKSGLTGLAQVSGRNRISFDERRQLDMYYVQNWSFWLDIVILIKTLRVVLQGNE